MASFSDIGEQVALRKEHNFNKRKIGLVQDPYLERPEWDVD